MDKIRKIEENKYWIWLSIIPSLGSVKKQKLLKVFRTPKKIYDASKTEINQINGIGEKLAEKILNKKIKNDIDRHISYLRDNNIQIITIQDDEYPQQLKNIYDYPISLYVKGDISILNSQNVSIIGCRNATNYGLNSAKYFSYNLALNGRCIVSGLARGIDSYAHIGALEAKGKTIAVLGNGLDMIYPKENKELAEMIIANKGAIISEYPLGTKPEKINFPARNRIISGLCESVLVIEAKEKSGTLITVDFALDQGKEVFVVPGNINSLNSLGTNRLIKEGAKLANCYEDLL